MFILSCTCKYKPLVSCFSNFADDSDVLLHADLFYITHEDCSFMFGGMPGFVLPDNVCAGDSKALVSACKVFITLCYRSLLSSQSHSKVQQIVTSFLGFK